MIKLLNEPNYHTLFAMHHVNGTTYHCRPLAKKLINICSLYGIDNTSLFSHFPDDYTSIPLLAEKYVNHIMEISPREPYYFFAHCFGSFFAYEVCKQLETKKIKIGTLFLVDPPVTNFIEQDDTLGLGMIFSSFCGVNDVDVKRYEIFGLSYLKALEYIVAKVKKISYENAGSLADEIDYENIERVIRVHLSNLLASENYSFCSKIKSIAILSPERSDEKIETILSKWQKISNDKINVNYLPGNSLTVLQEPSVSSIAKIIKNYVEKENGETA